MGGLIGYEHVSRIRNSFSTGAATASNGTPGGLIGDYDLMYREATNNWWLNGTNTVDTGDNGDVNDAWIAKFSAGSDAFNPAHTVYQNSAVSPAASNAWDFTNTWRAVADALPRLKWES